MTAPAKLRWGILGCARITRRGLVPGIRDSSTGVLHALASRDGTTARAWADEFGVPKSYGSYEEVVADPDVDAIYIPLPNELHRPWTERAADAGKHVLCEKPMAMDAAEARTMAEHCRARGVVLREAFMWRHQPRTAEIVRRVADGAIGQLRLIRSSFSFPIDMSDWRLDPSRGGGALWDVGTYGVSTARLYAGAEPESIEAVARFGPSGVDLSLVAALKFPNGRLAAIDCSFEQPFRCTYELVGTGGQIEVPDAYLPPERPVARYVPTSGFESGQPEEWTFDGRNQYACMVDAFAEAVASGGSGGSPGEDGVGQMAALEAILAAARSA